MPKIGEKFLLVKVSDYTAFLAGCETNNKCEMKVDMYLNDFCAQFMTTEFTTTSPMMITSIAPQSSQTPHKLVVENSVPITILEVLLGLSMMLQAVVITGWVCTCIYTKHKLAVNQSQSTR